MLRRAYGLVLFFIFGEPGFPRVPSVQHSKPLDICTLCTRVGMYEMAIKRPPSCQRFVDRPTRLVVTLGPFRTKLYYNTIIN